MKADPREFPRLSELINLTQEILLMHKSFNSEKLNRVIESFLQQVDGCRVTAKPLNTNKTYPLSIIYLHENKRLITKSIMSPQDLMELTESTFVQAYWELNSVGDAIKALLQASQVGADPECLLDYYQRWDLKPVIVLLDDEGFRDHYLEQVTKWTQQAQLKKEQDAEFLNTLTELDKFF